MTRQDGDECRPSFKRQDRLSLRRPPVGNIFEGQTDAIDAAAQSTRVHHPSLPLQRQRVATVAQAAFHCNCGADPQRYARIDTYAPFAGIHQLCGNDAHASRFCIGADANALRNLRTPPGTSSLFGDQGAHNNDIGRFGPFREDRGVFSSEKIQRNRPASLLGQHSRADYGETVAVIATPSFRLGRLSSDGAAQRGHNRLHGLPRLCPN